MFTAYGFHIDFQFRGQKSLPRDLWMAQTPKCTFSEPVSSRMQFLDFFFFSTIFYVYWHMLGCVELKKLNKLVFPMVKDWNISFHNAHRLNHTKNQTSIITRTDDLHFRGRLLNRGCDDISRQLNSILVIYIGLLVFGAVGFLEDFPKFEAN